MRSTRPSRLATALLAVVAAGTSLCAGAQQAGDKAAYESARAAAKSAYETARKRCDALSGTARDICAAEAKAERTKTEAQAEAAYKDTPKARASAVDDIAEANYKVDRERCNERSGNDKDVCIKVAKAELTRAKANARARLKTIEARNDAARAKRDADYDVAAQKCAALDGDARSACVATAKGRYGK